MSSCIEKRYLARINVLKLKEIISSKTQIKETLSVDQKH